MDTFYSKLDKIKNGLQRIVLLFHEVMTAFRAAYRGARSLVGINAVLSYTGKIIL